MIGGTPGMIGGTPGVLNRSFSLELADVVAWPGIKER